jgi:hypothetical protein
MMDQLAPRLEQVDVAPRQRRAVSLMERAPQFVIYALHPPYALYLTLRYRGATLPTAANPGLEGSGLTKESKVDLFNLLGPIGREHLPPFIPLSIGPEMLREASRAMEEGGLRFPVVVKPDIGRRGFGVKMVRSEQELAEHLGKFPHGVRVLIQRYVEGPGEAGLFYLRMPSETRGRVLSLTIKHFPAVIGDGKSTLRDLILQDRRAWAFAEVYFKRNRKHLDRVIPFGESYRIVSLGNHVRGAAFEDGSDHITPALEQVVDTIVQEVPGFFVGRFDVRYRTLEELKRGEGFTIIEYNGAGGEPTHIWDPRTSIVDTYAGLLAHLRYLYVVGAANRARGARPLAFREIVKRYFDELRLLRSYPDEE